VSWYRTHSSTAFDTQRLIAAVKLESDAELDGGDTIEARKAWSSMEGQTSFK
jgi:hypothetical protein